jgi:hypothetical protein
MQGADYGIFGRFIWWNYSAVFDKNFEPAFFFETKSKIFLEIYTSNVAEFDFKRK